MILFRARIFFPGITLLAGCCLMMAAASCDRSPTSATTQPARPQVAVIPKGTTHEYWKSIHAGANKAGAEFGIDILWKGPLKEDDREDQIRLVEDFVNRHVAGIVLAPLDDTALVAPVKTADAEHIPVVIIDSALKSDDIVSFCATDNFKGGQMAGDELARLIGDKGKVIMLRYNEGSASTTARENGFLDAIKKHPGVQVVVDNQYAGATAESAQAKSENILAPLKNPDGSLTIDGIFCCNESSTFGMLRTLEDTKLAGKVKFVGFDASTKLVAALSNGEINALIVQDPFNMGYIAVKLMSQTLKHQPVEKKIDTGATLVTRANMSDPKINALLHPPLAQYLKD